MGKSSPGELTSWMMNVHKGITGRIDTLRQETGDRAELLTGPGRERDPMIAVGIMTREGIEIEDPNIKVGIKWRDPETSVGIKIRKHAT